MTWPLVDTVVVSLPDEAMATLKRGKMKVR